MRNRIGSTILISPAVVGGLGVSATGVSAAAPPPTSPASDPSPAPTVTATVSISGDGQQSTARESSGSSGSSSGCGVWQRTTVTVDADGAQFYPAAIPVVAESPEGTATLYWRRCGSEFEDAFLPDGAEETVVTVDDLVPGAYDEMSRRDSVAGSVVDGAAD